MKFGYVAVLGQPNAGKSSLVNALVGEDVAIVTRRRQTTRNNILGIRNGTSKGEKYQIVFVDTPGIHHSKNNLDRFMNKSVRSAIAGADVVLYLVDGSKEIDDEESKYIENLRTKTQNLIVLQTKSDKKQILDIKNATKISSVTGENLDSLIEKIVACLPEGQPLYDDDLFTDKSVAFLIAEKIRGLLLENLDEEIPHGVAVVITSFDESEDFADISADIVCEREQHKGIIIGRGGKMLKQIGQAARIYAENLLDKKCNLKLFVRVDKDWRDKNVGTYGYN